MLAINWEIAGMPEGEYTVTASKDGYTFAPENVELGNDEFRHEVVIVPLSKLKVKVVAEPRIVKQDDNVIYIATIINGGDEIATGVVLTNVLAANADGLVSIEALDGGECDTDTVTCTLPGLTAGDSARVKIVMAFASTRWYLGIALTRIVGISKMVKRCGRGCKPRPAMVRKRCGSGCKPRPAIGP